MSLGRDVKHGNMIPTDFSTGPRRRRRGRRRSAGSAGRAAATRGRAKFRRRRSDRPDDRHTAQRPRRSSRPMSSSPDALGFLLRRTPEPPVLNRRSRTPARGPDARGAASPSETARRGIEEGRDAPRADRDRAQASGNRPLPYPATRNRLATEAADSGSKTSRQSVRSAVFGRGAGHPESPVIPRRYPPGSGAGFPFPGRTAGKASAACAPPGGDVAAPARRRSEGAADPRWFRPARPRFVRRRGLPGLTRRARPRFPTSPRRSRPNRRRFAIFRRRNSSR